MRRILLLFALMVFILIGIPILIIYNIGGIYSPEGIDGETVSVYIKSEDRVVDMKIGDYLKGVVAAEMPAEFHEEALKAQAVAARSFLKARSENYKKNGTPPEHKGAITCTDYAHCKAWISEEDRKNKWEEDKRNEYWKKICAAVDDTKGIIMTYNGEPVNALFHSTSSGRTERAEDVWGGSVPYLQSVESPGDLESPKYFAETEFTPDEFKQRAEQNIDGFDWSKGIVGEIKRSDAGGIITIVIGGVEIKGTKFRTIYDLRSTNAEIDITESNVKITTKGYGHGVGMSQYGAQYFANKGMDYKEILKTYYTDIEIK